MALSFKERLDCEYRRVGHFTAAFKPRDYDSLAREVEFLAHSFGHTTRLVGPGAISEELGSPLYHGGVVDESMNPAPDCILQSIFSGSRN